MPNKINMTPMSTDQVTAIPSVGDMITIAGTTTGKVVSIDQMNGTMTILLDDFAPVEWPLNADWSPYTDHMPGLQILDDHSINKEIETSLAQVLAHYSNSATDQEKQPDPSEQLNGSPTKSSYQPGSRRGPSVQQEILTREVNGNPELASAALMMKINAVSSHISQGNPIPNSALYSLIAACQLTIELQNR